MMPTTDFVPQKATQWLRPTLLAREGIRAVVSGVFGQFNDKRESLGALPAPPELDYSDHPELWIDYVSDTGDGFDATYSVARMVAQPVLPVDGHRTQRGRLLVLGGDQCYPSADVQGYRDRLIGPFADALPDVGAGDEAPVLLAVPGNHDWYDGLTAFMRTFCQQSWLGGWRTKQTRSYFSAQLPGRWWLWGIDIQFDTYIDDTQLRYFRKAAEQLRPGDALILCTAKPSWTVSNTDDVEAYDTLDFLERKVVRPTGARIRIAISGDSHHYARFAADDGSQRLTAGGGGAFLSATHHLPESIDIPPRTSRAYRGSSETFALQRIFPSREDSRRLARGILRLPLDTPGMTALMGVVQTAIFLSLTDSMSAIPRSPGDGPERMAAALRTATLSETARTLIRCAGPLRISAAVLGAALVFTGKPRTTKGAVVGVAHGLAHLTLVPPVAWAAARAGRGLPGAWPLVAATPLAGLVGGLVATELLACYLLLADRIGLNTTELFAAQAIPHYKNALRLKIDSHGVATIYALGLRRVPRWHRVDEQNGGHAFQAEEPLAPILIDSPVEVRR